MSKKQTRKQNGLTRYLAEKGIRRTAVCKATHLKYNRLISLTARGVEPTLSEAVKISQFLEKPLHDIWPELFPASTLDKSTLTTPNSHA